MPLAQVAHLLAGFGWVREGLAAGFSGPSQCAVQEIREQTRWRFSRGGSAVAVQLNGALVLLWAATNCSILAISSYCFAEACAWEPVADRAAAGLLSRRIAAFSRTYAASFPAGHSSRRPRQLLLL